MSAESKMKNGNNLAIQQPEIAGMDTFINK
jgi:hypothetical protein